MEFIIFLLILWLILKILKGIFSFLFGGSRNNQKTSTYNAASVDNKPSELKYKNEVYISFRTKVEKAFESYKESGHNIMWDSEADGFIMSENNSPTDGGIMYAVKVHYDDQNLFKLKDPFYILVTYGVLFERSQYDFHKEQAEYLNNYLYNEIKRPGIFYTLDTIKGTNFGVFYCNFVVSNNKNLCEETKKLGEARVFKQLISEARQAYSEGLELYGDKILKDAKNFSI